jgi:hypothetical protein
MDGRVGMRYYKESLVKLAAYKPVNFFNGDFEYYVTAWKTAAMHHGILTKTMHSVPYMALSEDIRLLCESAGDTHARREAWGTVPARACYNELRELQCLPHRNFVKEMQLIQTIRAYELEQAAPVHVEEQASNAFYLAPY